MFPTGALASSDIALLLFYLSVLGVLLLAGIFLRAKVPLFRKYFIPAALIAGVIGLLLGPYCFKLLPDDMVSSWGALPTTLIVIVFAPMLIGTKLPKAKGLKDLIVPEVIVGYSGSFIQVAVGFLLAGFVLTPLFQTNGMIGSIIEIGFCGGHGTAGGMQEAFELAGWAEGVDLSLVSATVGLLAGIVGGMIIINHGARKGYLSNKNVKSATELNVNKPAFLSKDQQEPSSYNTINKDVVEGFAFHFALIGVAVLLGYVIKYVLGLFIPGLPLFPMAMLGGLIINLIISHTKLINYVDRRTFQRIQGWCLDFLIVAAIASIKINVIVEYWAELLILMVAGVAISVWFFYFTSPRIFPEDWFEQGIINYGVFTGVTPVGLMLLRSVDPDMKTVAGEAFALQAPFTSPIVGGGLLTAALPMLAVQLGAWQTGLIFAGATIALFVLSRLLGYWKEPVKAAKAAK